MSVYFITCREMNTVKIGCSLDPHARVAEIRTGNPFTLKLEAVMPGSFAEEGDLHWRFADARLQGEWFRITPAIQALMSANPSSAAPKRSPVRSINQRPPIIFGETARQYEQRLLDEERAKELALEMIAYKRKIRAKEAAGEIHFPFRRGMMLVSAAA